jgi:hypothetical protein
VPDFDGETRYTLIAVISHRGSFPAGHYVAYVQPHLDSQWFLFDDDKVVPVPGLDQSSYFDGSDFSTYLVGYVRYDAIEAVRAKSAPPALSRAFSARLVFPPDTYGEGTLLSFRDPTMTIADLADRDISDFNVFVALPKLERLYGPLITESPALPFTIPGETVDFVFVPAPASECPIFFLRDCEPPEALSKDDLFSRYSDTYDFTHCGVPLSEEAELDPGAVVTGVVKSVVEIVIDDKPYSLPPDTTYAGVQLMLAEGDEAFAARTVLLSGSLVLCASSAPTVRRLLRFPGPLSSATVDPPATAFSLSLFLRVSISYYGPNARDARRVNAWVPMGSTIQTVAGKIKQWIGPTEMLHFTISELSHSEIRQPLPLWQALSAMKLRVDGTRFTVPCKPAEFRSAMENKNLVVEVRTFTPDDGWAGRTVGLFEVADEETVAEFQEKVIDSREEWRAWIEGAQDNLPARLLDRYDVLAAQIIEITQGPRGRDDRPVVTFEILCK